jgi:hypothetical protein
MSRTIVCGISLLLLAVPARGQQAESEGDKVLSGMSIVGNDDAPKSLVIVPWKTSDPGDRLDVSRLLDDGRRPVDRDVFMRELDYYDIWAQSQPASGLE